MHTDLLFRWARVLVASALLAAVALARAEPPATEAEAGAGSVVAIGGALRADNDAVWQRLVDLAGGAGARYVVFGTASRNPARAAAQAVEALVRRGAVAEALVLGAPTGATAGSARDPALVERVLAADGVYFTGGAQARITAALLDEAGRSTPVLDAIWQVVRRGGVVAGTSAGAAIMSSTMFRDAPVVLDALKSGLRDGIEIDRGLGFVGPDVFVDQHFLKRGRFGRMLPLMVQKHYRLGVGVDENTAAVFREGAVEVVGARGVLVVDLTDARNDPKLGAFNLRNARLSYLERGDRYDLATRQTTPAPEKLREPPIDPNAPDFKPYYTREMFQTDMLGDTTVAKVMTTLIDHRQRELVGLAFGGPTSPRPELGFEFRFRKGPQSLGHYTSALGSEEYTVTDILLDVTPVQISQPLYRPLRAASAPEPSP